MLYILTGSPSVASLTYNNQSRTLTCTTTGGPATAVTWRRNGVVITLNATYQQTKRLVDPVNGTYQTVLTIDSSVGPNGFVGNYNCTVENIRGTSSKSVFVGETYFLLFLLAITPSLTFHLCDSHVTVMWPSVWQSCDSGETYFLLFLLAITPSLTFLEGERWSGWIDYITPYTPPCCRVCIVCK